MKTKRLPQFVYNSIINLILLLIVVAWTIPTFGLFVSSFRSSDDISRTGWWTSFERPQEFTFDNYFQIILGKDVTFTNSQGNTVRASGDDLGRAMVNSLTVTIPSVIIPILIAAAAAYAFAWLRFPGKRLLFILLVALLVVPLQISLIPVLRDFLTLGINGTYLAIWIAHTGFGLPLCVYILYNYISTLPYDIFESAHIDGASQLVIFTRLVIPLALPALAAFSIYQFIWVYNDLLVALVFLGNNAEVMVLTQKLQNLIGTRGQDWHLLTAGAFITMLVPMAVFLLLQRFFVRGMLAGAVKG